MPGVAEQPATLARLRRSIQLDCGCSSSGRSPIVDEDFKPKARSYPAKIARDLTELPNFRLGAPQSKTQQSNGFDGVRLASATSDIPAPPTEYLAEFAMRTGAR
jgi:hypothetical protein